MGLKLIYWTIRTIWKNSCFYRWLRLDWGNTTWTAAAGLGSKELSQASAKHKEVLSLINRCHTKS